METVGPEGDRNSESVNFLQSLRNHLECSPNTVSRDKFNFDGCKMQEFSLEQMAESIHYGKTKAYFEEVY